MFSAILTVSLGGLFYLLTLSKMSSPIPNLEVRLQPPEISAPITSPVPLTIKLSILNNAGSPVTILNWNTPLDARVGILGVFEIRDTENNEVLPLDSIKFARQLPPPREDFVVIPAGEGVDAEVVIPRVPLAEGRKYTIQAKGWWQAVWEKPMQEVPDADLDKLSGALRGAFESGIVDITFTQT